LVIIRYHKGGTSSIGSVFSTNSLYQIERCLFLFIDLVKEPFYPVVRLEAPLLGLNFRSAKVELLDVRLSLDHDLTIKQGHDIAHEIRNVIQKRYSDVEEVLIHVNPYFDE
jgi:hypothetical protein